LKIFNLYRKYAMGFILIQEKVELMGWIRTLSGINWSFIDASFRLSLSFEISEHVTVCMFIAQSLLFFSSFSFFLFHSPTNAVTIVFIASHFLCHSIYVQNKKPIFNNTHPFSPLSCISYFSYFTYHSAFNIIKFLIQITHFNLKIIQMFIFI